MAEEIPKESKEEQIRIDEAEKLRKSKIRKREAQHRYQLKKMQRQKEESLRREREEKRQEDAERQLMKMQKEVEFYKQLLIMTHVNYMQLKKEVQVMTNTVGKPYGN